MPAPIYTAKSHPLPYEDYRRLYDEVSEIRDAFSGLGHHDLSRAFTEVLIQLNAAHEMVVETERREWMRDYDKLPPELKPYATRAQRMYE